MTYAEGWYADKVKEQAAEIERQKSDIDRLMDERQGWLEEIERLRAALTLIASFKGKTLFSYTRGDDGDSAYREGANAAFEQMADIAQSALADLGAGE